MSVIYQYVNVKFIAYQQEMNGSKTWWSKDAQTELVDFQTKVIGLPLLCGKNIGQSRQRDLEVGVSDPLFFSDIYDSFSCKCEGFGVQKSEA